MAEIVPDEPRRKRWGIKLALGASVFCIALGLILAFGKPSSPEPAAVADAPGELPAGLPSAETSPRETPPSGPLAETPTSNANTPPEPVPTKLPSIEPQALNPNVVSTSHSDAEEPNPLKAPFDETIAAEGQQAWAEYLGQQTLEVNSHGMKLALIPPGSYSMGPNNGTQQIPVTLTRPFYLGQTEVTQAQWKKVMRTEPWRVKRNALEGEAYPATFVNWNMAVEFCRQLSLQERSAGKLQEGWVYTLPSEAQWEYACRAGTVTKYSFGNDDNQLEDYAWYRGNAWDRNEKYAHQVGQKPSNAFGLYDMHGNVREWCGDGYPRRLSGGTDPRAPIQSAQRGARGGSFVQPWKICSSGLRSSGTHTDSEWDCGFRIAVIYAGTNQTPLASRGPFPKPADPTIAGPAPLKVPFDMASAKAGQQAWAEFLGQDIVRTSSQGMKLRLIPPGTFFMGEEGKQVFVTLTRPFYLGETEVTQGQWTRVMKTSPWENYRSAQTAPESQDNPAENLHWDEAMAFCERLTRQEQAKGQLPVGWAYTLPTEAQWEYACRGGTETRFSFGDDLKLLDDYAWHHDNTWPINERYPHPVAQKRPNPLGLYDMHGNVKEWCRDGFQAKLPGGGDPEVPAKDVNRVCRSGYWHLNYGLCSSTYRFRVPSSKRIASIGFRVALVPVGGT